MMANSSEFVAAVLPRETGGERRRKLLESVPGVQMRDSYRGTWSHGTQSAELLFDALDDLRIRALPDRPPSARQALESNGLLPGNWRWAIDGGRWLFLADIHNQQWPRFGPAFRALEGGLAPADDVTVYAATEVSQDASPLDPKTVDGVLHEQPWDDQSVVRLDDGWELRPRCHTQPVPVVLRIAGSQLHCRRTVLRALPEGIAAESICDQSLRFNAHLKHARLACAAGALVAEARMHHELVSGPMLAVVARAVALADRRVRNTLEVLSSSPELAGHYASAMLNFHHPSSQAAAPGASQDAAERR